MITKIVFIWMLFITTAYAEEQTFNVIIRNNTHFDFELYLSNDPMTPCNVNDDDNLVVPAHQSVKLVRLTSPGGCKPIKFLFLRNSMLRDVICFFNKETNIDNKTYTVRLKPKTRDVYECIRVH